MLINNCSICRCPGMYRGSVPITQDQPAERIWNENRFGILLNLDIPAVFHNAGCNATPGDVQTSSGMNVCFFCGSSAGNKQGSPWENENIICHSTIQNSHGIIAIQDDAAVGFSIGNNVFSHFGFVFRCLYLKLKSNRG